MAFQKGKSCKHGLKRENKAQHYCCGDDFQEGFRTNARSGWKGPQGSLFREGGDWVAGNGQSEGRQSQTLRRSEAIACPSTIRVYA